LNYSDVLDNVILKWRFTIMKAFIKMSKKNPYKPI
jgi:hypothetical protein